MARNPDMVGRYIVVGPGQATSHWQPRPANGYIDLVLTPEVTGHSGFVQGFQSVAAGSHIAPHQHLDVCEILVCVAGRGRVVTDRDDTPFVPETVCFIGHDVRHSVVNDGDDHLRLLWIQLPAGHEQLFPRIGKPRRPEEPAPAPFDRPAEAKTWARDLGVNFESGKG